MRALAKQDSQSEKLETTIKLTTFTLWTHAMTAQTTYSAAKTTFNTFTKKCLKQTRVGYLANTVAGNVLWILCTISNSWQVYSNSESHLGFLAAARPLLTAETETHSVPEAAVQWAAHHTGCCPLTQACLWLCRHLPVTLCFWVTLMLKETGLTHTVTFLLFCDGLCLFHG